MICTHYRHNSSVVLYVFVIAIRISFFDNRFLRFLRYSHFPFVGGNGYNSPFGAVRYMTKSKYPLDPASWSWLVGHMENYRVLWCNIIIASDAVIYAPFKVAFSPLISKKCDFIRRICWWTAYFACILGIFYNILKEEEVAATRSGNKHAGSQNISS